MTISMGLVILAGMAMTVAISMMAASHQVMSVYSECTAQDDLLVNAYLLHDMYV